MKLNLHEFTHTVAGSVLSAVERGWEGMTSDLTGIYFTHQGLKLFCVEQFELHYKIVEVLVTGIDMCFLVCVCVCVCVCVLCVE